MFKNTITNTGQSPSFGIWAFAAFRPQLIFLDLHRCAILKEQKIDDVLNTFEEPISFPEICVQSDWSAQKSEFPRNLCTV